MTEANPVQRLLAEHPEWRNGLDLLPTDVRTELDLLFHLAVADRDDNLTAVVYTVESVASRSARVLAVGIGALRSPTAAPAAWAQVKAGLTRELPVLRALLPRPEVAIGRRTLDALAAGDARLLAWAASRSDLRTRASEGPVAASCASCTADSGLPKSRQSVREALLRPGRKLTTLSRLRSAGMNLPAEAGAESFAAAADGLHDLYRRLADGQS